MTIVIDTNVVAYFVLKTEPFWPEAESLWNLPLEMLAPVHWEAEFINVVWTVVRRGALSATEGRKRLDIAARLGIQSIPVSPLSGPAFDRAVTTDVSPYDTLFVQLAVERACKLVTFDAAILKHFPAIAVRPEVIAPRLADDITGD